MVILSLTSTPPRFPYLPKFFASIERQRVKPDVIELNIPLNYIRFPGEVQQLPNLPDFVALHRVETDLGPATKILPTAARWREKNPDIVFCDDDQFYDRDWFGRFAELRRQKPIDALCLQGGFLPDVAPSTRRLPAAIETPREIKDLKYRMKRLASFLGLAKPRREFSESGYVDAFQGFGGVCIRPDQLPAEAWSIPDIMFTEDDIWLSGMLNLNGVGIWLDAEGGRPSVFRASSDKTPLKQINNITNLRCIPYMKQRYNIWE